ncbi:N-acetylneuraminate lyase A [Anopheles gambiae]|uniref:N-acetylneuraminate lyase n=2 Tax=gambiae species complex TaxID=44542 RepID=A0A8W7P4Y3_ANOCL|nr:N-acetylneuraminate lyase A-like [Anopheles coluzzii]XP_308175.4 N-acetylneuraminate lyase A [Anopheles gambiae]
MKSFSFTGLMAPVFTPYTNNNEKVNINAIEPYVELLKANHVNGVLVNGTTGEGMLMTTEERMLVTEAWQRSCKKHGITIMVQIGGAAYPDVVQLAQHASKMDVDAVLCLPELYFKPKSCEQLVTYLKGVAMHCPTTPFFYYHIPMFTDVNLHMPTFLDRAEKEIANFRGIKYTSGDLEQGSSCLKEGRTIFLGADTILCGAVAAGFDSFIMTTINICPEAALEIIAAMDRGAVADAREKQRLLNARIAEILAHGDWVSAMKKAFRERFPSIEVGTTRPPLNM